MPYASNPNGRSFGPRRFVPALSMPPLREEEFEGSLVDRPEVPLPGGDLLVAHSGPSASAAAGRPGWLPSLHRGPATGFELQDEVPVHLMLRPPLLTPHRMVVRDTLMDNTTTGGSTPILNGGTILPRLSPLAALARSPATPPMSPLPPLDGRLSGDGVGGTPRRSSDGAGAMSRRSAEGPGLAYRRSEEGRNSGKRRSSGGGGGGGSGNVGSGMEAVLRALSSQSLAHIPGVVNSPSA